MLKHRFFCIKNFIKFFSLPLLVFGLSTSPSLIFAEEITAGGTPFIGSYPAEQLDNLGKLRLLLVDGATNPHNIIYQALVRVVKTEPSEDFVSAIEIPEEDLLQILGSVQTLVGWGVGSAPENKPYFERLFPDLVEKFNSEKISDLDELLEKSKQVSNLVAYAIKFRLAKAFADSDREEIREMGIEEQQSIGSIIGGATLMLNRQLSRKQLDSDQIAERISVYVKTFLWIIDDGSEWALPILQKYADEQNWENNLRGKQHAYSAAYSTSQGSCEFIIKGSQ